MTLLAAIRRKTRLLARVGCVSIGTVYILIGAVALLALSGRMIEMADETPLLHDARVDAYRVSADSSFQEAAATHPTTRW